MLKTAVTGVVGVVVGAAAGALGFPRTVTETKTVTVTSTSTTTAEEKVAADI